METVNQHTSLDGPPIAFLEAIPSSPPPPQTSDGQRPSSSSTPFRPAQQPPHASGTQEARTKKTKQKPQAEDKLKGHTMLPLTKVQKIMKTEHEIAMSSKEAVFLVAAAAEEFMKRFALAGHRQATDEKRTVITQADMANAAHDLSQYNFLQETIPRPISITAALRLRELKQNEPAAVEEGGSSSLTFPPQHQHKPTNKRARVVKEQSQTNGRVSRRKSATISANTEVSSTPDAAALPSQQLPRVNGRTRRQHGGEGPHPLSTTAYLQSSDYYAETQEDNTPPSPQDANSHPTVGRTIYSRNMDPSLL